ncbi:TIGR01777 family oxidoreductase [Bacillus sp. ISL-41]|uniref:TIGR01777 family oxidoreductase n=1 Tax=unclassified Bacillus (in: firmicutes) TaxID=185979 RepID=UPI001BE4E6C7|nr:MULTISPECIES: TIGR01777 family oxidoreductase [unclassified Bacillus (in: firmicutes)]MBT2637549.1 TIGR01777 family oxidoreductase [Bacillus sp. ISL-39]MBT2640753.1 TIGR01777 family oxidoreductase [Bacillus sp. ISL-41]
MKVAITGGTGLVGKALSSYLIQEGHQVYILTRNPESQSSNPKFVQWLNPGDEPEKELEGIDTIVNLAGATINSKWTDEYKHKIIASRLKATDEVKRIIEMMPKKPSVLINASAVGYYGTSVNKEFTEQSHKGSDFLAETVDQWEASAAKVNVMGVRSVFCRFGVILDKTAGALPRMVLPYKFFAGGKIGSGKQWLSWIHIEDVVRGVIFAIENNKVSGPVNFTAPCPVKMEQFGETLSRVIKRPHWMPVPSFALKVLLGEMSILVLEGQRAIPEKLLKEGFTFRYPELQDALIEIFGK